MISGPPLSRRAAQPASGSEDQLEGGARRCHPESRWLRPPGPAAAGGPGPGPVSLSAATDAQLEVIMPVTRHGDAAATSAGQSAGGH